jgi:hypothetical protein
MHNHIRLKRARLPRAHCLDIQLRGTLFDAYRLGFQTKVYPKFAGSLNQLIDEIRVKKGKWASAAMQYGYLRSRKRRNMRKFKGDIPASDKENPSREFV